MKKNKMLRIASILLVVTLLSTCVISGTFAKYVTKAEGEDHARVAKWGVVLDITGDSAFSDVYEAEDETYVNAGGEYSVKANEAYDFDEDGEIDKLVAPGTKMDGLVATVYGQPEVAARYTLEGSGIKDICLPAGEYTDYTEYVLGEGYTKKFTTTTDYHPVVWDLTIAKNGDTPIALTSMLYDGLSAYPDLLAKAEALGFSRNGCSLLSGINILKKVAGNQGYENIVDTALSRVVSGGRNFQLDIVGEDGFKMSYDFDPNKEMNFTFGLSWQWLFDEEKDNAYLEGTVDGETVNVVDMADTFLGNWMAVELGQDIDGFVAPEKGGLEISAHFIATATQID